MSVVAVSLKKKSDTAMRRAVVHDPKQQFPKPRGFLCQHLIDQPRRVFFFSSRRRHTRCQSVTGVQTCALPIYFRIHFRPAYRDVALTEAREAERAYALLASELHPPRGTVDLTLGDDIDGSNGFTTVFPSGRITILAPAPATDPGLLQYDTWLRLVTTHELEIGRAHLNSS